MSKRLSPTILYSSSIELARDRGACEKSTGSKTIEPARDRGACEKSTGSKNGDDKTSVSSSEPPCVVLIGTREGARGRVTGDGVSSPNTLVKSFNTFCFLGMRFCEGALRFFESTLGALSHVFVAPQSQRVFLVP